VPVSQLHPDTTRSVEFVWAGERFRVERSAEGPLDISIYHLHPLSPGAGRLLRNEDAHERVWAEGFEALERLATIGPSSP
jgi:hypothetical protein